MTTDLIKTLEGLEKKATKGPWQKLGEKDAFVFGMPKSPKTRYDAHHYFCGGGVDPDNYPVMHDNVTLILELRNSLPKIIAALKNSHKCERCWSNDLVCGKAWKDERDKLKAELDEALKDAERMREALKRLCSVVNTVNHGKNYEMKIPSDDEPVLPQRKEWVEYLLETNREAAQAINPTADTKESEK